MKQSKEPLVLSGRLFVDKLLAYEHPGLALAGPLRKGDLKVLCVAERTPKGVRTYAGFYTAYVFDGGKWRKLALREYAALKSAYKSDAERKRLFPELRDGLRRLKGRTAEAGDGGYWVQAQVQPQPVTPPPARVEPVRPQPQPQPRGRRREKKGDDRQMLLFE